MEEFKSVKISGMTFTEENAAQVQALKDQGYKQCQNKVEGSGLRMYFWKLP
jgi:ribulose bisphosphate carboxylase small subunit